MTQRPRPRTAELLDLAPHPEGGWYRETWRAGPLSEPDGYPGPRAAATGIYFLLPPFPGVPVGRHLLGVPLIVLGAVLAVVAYAEWVRNQRALRRGEPLPRSLMPWILAATIAGMAVVAAIVLLASALR